MGWSVVSADFVSQESRIACAMLTDARAGEHNSNLWSQAVMSGDKAEKTDVHNLTASRLNITRNQAKGVNFAIQYGAGHQGLSNQIRLAKGCSESEASYDAAEFIKYLKGFGGAAETTFYALEYCSSVTNLETYLLGVRQPNTLNPKYLPGKNDFKTVRGNWPIQSSGVDEKHTLILLIEHLSKERGITAQFLLDVHDRVAFMCPDKYTEELAKVFDLAMENFMCIAYEAAAKFWDKVHPRVDKRKVLKPMDNWIHFERVDISKSLVEG